MASLKVAVRVRPFNQREIDMNAKLIVEMDGKKTRLMKPRHQSISRADSSAIGAANASPSAAASLGRENFNDFTFDYSYWSFEDEDDHYATQDQVYEDLGTDVIDCAFQGYNACVFAYGQTGSGKTFTMMGSPEMLGLIPRICKAMFARMKLGQEAGTGYKTQVSYLEIYNERVKDLLGPHSVGHGLRVREHRVLGPYVENLSQHAVNDYNEIQECISRGNIQRTTASTNMNDTSSRSHAIFTITFVQAGFMNEMPSETVSKIHLVDLAGSERANATGATGQRLKEGAHINKSLVTLGSVISALAEQTNPTNSKKILYIPYRDSVLTWLLKDSLGGNSKTIMIAAISPADCNYSETLSTLRYANRAKNIINKPTVNEDPNVKLIRELRDEINNLKSQLTGESPLLEMSSKMLEDLQKKEAQEKVLTEDWTEKWREAQSILREQKSLGLRKSGVGVVLDSEVPHLIGIHDDNSTGVTLYSLKDGETLIGTDDADEPQDIVLTGLGIYPEHCSIVLENGCAVIHPRHPQAQCWLNANLIDQPQSISQGDILLLGRTNMFRFNNPAEAAKMRSDATRSRLDLSRLSLIAASRENLNGSMYCDDDHLNQPPYKKQYCPSEQLSRDDPELQEEHRKILQTIENALKQLNIERVQMHELYKSKVKKLSDELKRLEQSQQDSMSILNCRAQELIARKEMILWEKGNEQTQIDIVVRQISALQTQLDSKKRDFIEYVAKELQELQDLGKLDELNIKIADTTPLSDDSSAILLQVSDNLDGFSAQYIRETVKRNRDDISKIEKDLLDKEDVLEKSSCKLITFDTQLEDIDRENALLLEEKVKLDEIQAKKQSLSLNLKTTTRSADADGKAPETLETFDTFHTANSDCSITFSTPSGQRSSPNPSDVTTNTGMSDSGVELDPKRVQKSAKPLANQHLTATLKNFDDDTTSCSSCENSSVVSRPLCAMHNLRHQIAVQKSQIMKILGLDCEKDDLDDKIAQLQELQKQYVLLEKEFQDANLNDRADCCLSDGELTMENVRRLAEHSSDVEGSQLGMILPSSGYLASNDNTSITRSMPSIGPYSDSEQIICIPSFIIRGAGKQTHYEFEVRISLPEERWILLRRFSRFRELHLSMKNTYGEKVASIPFPRRELFASKSENVARNRRRQLECYLRCLLNVCSQIPQSPIFDGPGGVGLTKTTLGELSSFFKKGLFESGKHGTG